jgi:hypothetical protein
MKQFKIILRIAFVLLAAYSVYKGNPFEAKDYALGAAILLAAVGTLTIK